MSAPLSKRKPGQWFCVLLLSDQEGPAWLITAPNGLNWFAEAWDAAEEDPRLFEPASHTTIQGLQVSEEEVAAARRTLDAQDPATRRNTEANGFRQPDRARGARLSWRRRTSARRSWT